MTEKPRVALVAAITLLVPTMQTAAAEPPAQETAWPNRTHLPTLLAPFEGKIGKSYKESTPAWQNPVAAPEGAPNVVVILPDDIGFGQPSTFGGLIPTPNLDKLAAEGLRCNEFHTTAICGPSRAALLTGRNHHDAGSGFLMEWATGFPSYSTLIPKSTATVAEVLRDNGYATWWYGKNHNTPTGRRLSPARSTAGPPGWALTTSTASTPVRPTSTTRCYSKTPCRWSRARRRSRVTTS